jgi:hypothetical protein
MDKNYPAIFDALAVQYLGRHLTSDDGLPTEFVNDADRELGVKVPVALRTYYAVAGRLDELNHVHNELLAPSEIGVDAGFLIFMHENQAVVSWGFRVEDLSQDDPMVWQRNNTPPEEWFSEDLRFSAFLESMFAWYAHAGVLVKL